MKKALILLISTIVIFCPEVYGSDTDLPLWMQEFLTAVNEYREEKTDLDGKNRSPLCYNDKLNAQAQDHIDYMVDNDTFTYFPNGKQLRDIADYDWRDSKDPPSPDNYAALLDRDEATVPEVMESIKNTLNKGKLLSENKVHIGVARDLNPPKWTVIVANPPNENEFCRTVAPTEPPKTSSPSTSPPPVKPTPPPVKPTSPPVTPPSPFPSTSPPPVKSTESPTSVGGAPTSCSCCEEMRSEMNTILSEILDLVKTPPEPVCNDKKGKFKFGHSQKRIDWCALVTKQKTKAKKKKWCNKADKDGDTGLHTYCCEACKDVL